MKKFLFAFAVLLLVGCRCQKEVPTQTVVVTEYKTVAKTDSVYVDRWHTLTTKGDTIFLRDSVITYRYSARVDTLIVHDTVTQQVTVVETKEVTKGRRPFVIVLILLIISVSVCLCLFKKC